MQKEIDRLNESMKLNKTSYEQKIQMLEEALKGKTKQLIDYIKQDRGRAKGGFI